MARTAALSFLVLFQVFIHTESLKLLVVTVATDETDGYKRFMHSAEYFNHDVLVIGMNEEWVGGDLRQSVGGGQKINMLKRDLHKYKDDDELVIMFTDSYDVVLGGDQDAILDRFLQLNAKVVFSAENTLWPDKSLINKYPVVDGGKRFLCSGGIIGFAKKFWSVINQWEVSDQDDDQLYYTHVYLNETLRKNLNATLDHTSSIFHNINFAKEEIELHITGEITVVRNIKYNTFPIVLHGNGPSKIYLNYLGNYVPDGWHPGLGCRNCDIGDVQYTYEDEETTPHVMMAIFVLEKTPFVNEFFAKIANLSYPKSSISLYIYTMGQSEERAVAQFLLKYRSLYRTVLTTPYYDRVDEWSARNGAIDHCLLLKCDFMFSIDSIVQITNKMTLKYLISKNRQVIAPIVKRHNKLWSNFWGALNVDGFYARSEDYLPIINNERTGVWNIPFMNSVYLIKGSSVKKLVEKVPQPFTNGDLDSDMAFCSNLRDEGIFIYVSNEEFFGRLLELPEYYDSKLHPDLWEIERNKYDWEEKYLHPSFWDAVNPEKHIDQPCPDVYSFPLMTEQYADQIVATAEDKNMWSNGKNEDPRIAGGYENVPTIDLHMNQMGYEKEWLHLLKYYISQIIEKVFPGYHTKATSSMMFIVRYKPDEQPFLRPHHDSSTWTMNVALNTQNKDYEGGGCRFLRYNCSVTSLPKGWAVVHPGRLTHYHEGLYTTNGTRYIFVSFVDP